MFDSIAPKYDLLNHLLSGGIDRRWRRTVVRRVTALHPRRILDVATGTGDLAIAMARRIPQARIVGGDLSEGMLARGREKVAARKLNDRITLQEEDALALSFADDTFDAVTVAFGARNFENLESGLREMGRTLRPGGQLFILEFSKPKNNLFAKVYYFYFKKILPAIGRLVSSDENAYTYLPASVMSFPCGEEMGAILRSAGYEVEEIRPFTMGIASLYVAKKPAE